MPPWQQEIRVFTGQMALAVAGPCVLSVIEGGNHVVNNMWYRYRDQTADWMAVQLGVAPKP